MTRRRYSAFLEEGLMDRLRLYAIALGDRGVPVSLSGLHEVALWEYLESRCDRLGAPRPGVSPQARRMQAGPGRPSRAAIAATFAPLLERRAGRLPGRMRTDR